MVTLQRWYAALPLLLAIAGCSTPQMRVDPALDGTAAAWPVQGRNGWLIDQVLTFGPYRSGPVSRGWTKGYDYPFIVRFTGAREKLRFAVRDDNGSEAMVHCAGKLREQDLRALREYFDVNIHTTDTFVGTILLNGERAFDFHIENLNVQQNLGYRPLEGAVQRGGQPIRMRAVWQTSTGQRWLDTQPIGVEFLRDGAVIGTVETVNNGRVWIRDGLGAEERMLVASLASALLLRSGLADHNEGP